MKTLVGSIVLAWLLTACPPSPLSPPPDADAVAPVVTIDAAPTPGASCDTACAAMQRAGCVVLPNCARTMCAANADPKFKHYDVVCITGAKTVADVVRCGADCSPPDGAKL